MRDFMINTGFSWDSYLLLFKNEFGNLIEPQYNYEFYGS